MYNLNGFANSIQNFFYALETPFIRLKYSIIPERKNFINTLAMKILEKRKEEIRLENAFPIKDEKAALEDIKHCVYFTVTHQKVRRLADSYLGREKDLITLDFFQSHYYKAVSRYGKSGIAFYNLEREQELKTYESLILNKQANLEFEACLKSYRTALELDKGKDLNIEYQTYCDPTIKSLAEKFSKTMAGCKTARELLDQLELSYKAIVNHIHRVYKCDGNVTPADIVLPATISFVVLTHQSQLKNWLEALLEYPVDYLDGELDSCLTHFSSAAIYLESRLKKESSIKPLGSQ